MRRRTSGVVLISALLTIGALAPPAGADPRQAGGTFLDDDTSVHEGMIEALHAQEILLGCNEARTLVCPEDELTRGQMASLLARAFDLPPASRDWFAEDGGAHEDAINRVREAEFAFGLDDGTFGAGRTITREQLASLVRRATGLPERTAGPFTDVAGTHAGAVNALAHARITVGCNAAGTRFCPRNTVTREQAASILGRAFELPPLQPRKLARSASVADWCAAADRFVRTLSPADTALLGDYGPWLFGSLRNERFAPGTLRFQLFAVSPLTDDPVVATWDRTDGLVLDRAAGADEPHRLLYMVRIERTGDGWSCSAN